MSDEGTPQGPAPWDQQPGGQPYQPPPPQPPQPAQPDYGQQYPTQQYPPQPPPAPQPDYGQQYPAQPPQPDYGQQYPAQPPQPDYGQQYPAQPPQPDYGQQYPTQQYPPQPGYGDAAQVPPGYGQPAYGAPPPPPGGPGGPGVPGQPGGGKGRRGLFAGVGVAVLAALAVLAYFLLSGGSSSASTPQDAVKKLMEAGKTLDINKAKSVLCQADQAMPQFTKPGESDRVVSYTIGTVTKKDSSHATVKVSIVSGSNSTPESTELPVKKEGGSWKVCVTDLLSTLPTSLPTPGTSGTSAPPTDGGLPSGLPTGLPTDILPSGLPTNILGNICANATDAMSPAATYIGAAEVGFTSVAQTCVWKDSVPESVTAQLKGKLFSPSGSDKTGGDDHGPKGVYDFASLDGKSKVEITTTKQSDGKYYVTEVKIS